MNNLMMKIKKMMRTILINQKFLINKNFVYHIIIKKNLMKIMMKFSQINNNNKNKQNKQKNNNNLDNQTDQINQILLKKLIIQKLY